MVKTGVVLLNMGGPDSLDAVRPFLYNLFSDRDIIPLGPPFMQKFIAWNIARKRAPKSRNLYTQIGGKSPLNEITFNQADALHNQLKQHGSFVVTAAMRYCPPRAEQAIAMLARENVERIILLPLYPHYSKATSGSSIKDVQQQIARQLPGCEVKIIQSWPVQPLYIRCLAENIQDRLSGLELEKTQIIYSAHSLPVSFIKEGDPYVEHLKQTITAIEKLTGVSGILCYQSRSGPVEWLSPDTSSTIRKCAEMGFKNLVVVPVSFVSDHVETLYEVDIMFRKEAEQLGLRLEMTQGLNCSPLFIEALVSLITE